MVILGRKGFDYALLGDDYTGSWKQANQKLSARDGIGVENIFGSIWLVPGSMV